MSSFDVAIVGSGSWGKALAHTLSINKKKVLIYSRNPEDKKYKFNSKNILQTNDKTDIFSHDSPSACL